jgi:V8-like Glu-specific endopeptidase
MTAASGRWRSLRGVAAALVLSLTMGACATSVRTAPPAAVSTVSASKAAAPLSTQGPSAIADPTTLPTVGPLFAAGLTSVHTCTASVVSSPAGDIIVTAAHCVSGTGAGLLFAPGYDNGGAPHGTWVVQRAYLSPNWITHQDPAADFAFLVVTPSATNRTRASVQSVVGANTLGSAPATGQRVTVAGYPIGHDDLPVVCTTTVYRTRGYPSFDCPGFADGTSGSPWIAHYNTATGTGTITALIGGLDQGGCTADTSYSAPFTDIVKQVYVRAVAGKPADSTPPAGLPIC